MNCIQPVPSAYIKYAFTSGLFVLLAQINTKNTYMKVEISLPSCMVMVNPDKQPHDAWRAVPQPPVEDTGYPALHVYCDMHAGTTYPDPTQMTG